MGALPAGIGDSVAAGTAGGEIGGQFFLESGLANDGKQLARMKVVAHAKNPWVRTASQ